MNYIKFTALCVTLFLVLLNTTLHAEEKLRISVAASMTDAFKDLIKNFSRQYPDIIIYPNFGPSGGLAKQIDLGAPADLYVSANPKWMDFLLAQNKIVPQSKVVFAYNSLVFIGSKTKINVSSLADLPKLQRIGIGSPASVPAGQYAKQAMVNIGVYDQLLKAGKLVLAKDVRQALIYADRGETDGSFVYATDAPLATRAEILFTLPQKLYDRVIYPMALTPAGMAKHEARAFYDFAISTAAADILKKYAFSTPEPLKY